MFKTASLLRANRNTIEHIENVEKTKRKIVKFASVGILITKQFCILKYPIHLVYGYFCKIISLYFWSLTIAYNLKRSFT